MIVYRSYDLERYDSITFCRIIGQKPLLTNTIYVSVCAPHMSVDGVWNDIIVCWCLECDVLPYCLETIEYRQDWLCI